MCVSQRRVWLQTSPCAGVWPKRVFGAADRTWYRVKGVKMDCVWTKRDDAIASMQQSRETDNEDGVQRDNSVSINSHRAPWIVR